jgi:hypothetical protein
MSGRMKTSRVRRSRKDEFLHPLGPVVRVLGATVLRSPPLQESALLAVRAERVRHVWRGIKREVFFVAKEFKGCLHSDAHLPSKGLRCLIHLALKWVSKVGNERMFTHFVELFLEQESKRVFPAPGFVPDANNDHGLPLVLERRRATIVVGVKL